MEFWVMVRAFFVNAGPGGVFAMLVLTLGLVIYIALTRWILAGGKSKF
jgi:hypothetical protein